ncbi:hypothetical protein BH10ACT3_BH10ACT3_03790 [soil metagenome]
MSIPPTPPDVSPNQPTVDELLAETGWQGHAAGPRSTLLTAAVERVRALDVLDDAIVAVERRTAPLREGALGHVLGGDWLGHAVHPMLTDIPIGCWTSASILDVVGGTRSRPAAQRLVGLGILSVVPTALTGWSEWSRIAAPELRRVGLVHAIGNAAATGLYAISWNSRRKGHQTRGAVTAFAGMGVATGAGLLGGYLLSARGVGTGARGLPPTHVG